MAWNNCEGARSKAHLLPLNPKLSTGWIPPLPCRKAQKPPREVWEYEGTGKCQRLRKRLIYPPASPDGVERPPPGFECTTEWQTTKPVCSGLFRALGEYYDEAWFPTLIREWSLLYYQCNHTCDYWQYKDEWLAGDEEVRMTVWAEILRHRSAFDRKREKRKRQLMAAGQCETEVEENLDKAIDMCAAINEANEMINVKKIHVDPNADNEDEEAAAEKCRLEKEMAEIALADPDDDPDWVEMRRRMRGSFAALNLAQHEIDHELLDHIMIELCKYWSRAPAIEHEVDPLLERNIMREIRNFRKRLFGVAELEEPPEQQCVPPSSPSPCARRQQNNFVAAVPSRQNNARASPPLRRRPLNANASPAMNAAARARMRKTARNK